MLLLTAMIRVNELGTPPARSVSTPSLLANLRASGSSQRHCRVRHGFGVRLICVKETLSRSAQNEQSARAVGQVAERRSWSDRSPVKSNFSSKAITRAGTEVLGREQAGAGNVRRCDHRCCRQSRRQSTRSTGPRARCGPGTPTGSLGRPPYQVLTGNETGCTLRAGAVTGRSRWRDTRFLSPAIMPGPGRHCSCAARRIPRRRAVDVPSAAASW